MGVPIAVLLIACGGASSEPHEPMIADASEPLPDAALRESDGGRDAEGPRGNALPPSGDVDGDGLDDRWEALAGDTAILSSERADSDGDGESDADEDPDGDGLSNLEEFAMSRVRDALGHSPHPLRLSLLVELDAMGGRRLDDAILAAAAGAFADLPFEPVSGHPGVDVHFYRDQERLPETIFDGSFEMRHDFLRQHGPGGLDDDASPPLPLRALVHVAVVAERSDDPNRAGEVVLDAEGRIANTGLLLYRDTIERFGPRCGGEAPPVTVAESLANTLIHELGHLLQLGHETSVGGGVNYFNVMSLPRTCAEVQQRFHGLGNDDPALGATEAAGAGRFSLRAAERMDFMRKLSVDTATLVDDRDGVEL